MDVAKQQPIASADEALQHTDRWLDARSGPSGTDKFSAGHVAGAVHADLDRDLAAPAEQPERGGRHPLPTIEAWCRKLGAWGITPSTRIAIYDDTGGAIAASRAWWMLRAVGHERVCVVDGGWHALVQAAAEVSTDVSRPAPCAPYPATKWQLPTVDIDDVAAAAAAPDGLVLDVREPARFRGEIEPLDPVAGRIPGAVNLPFQDNLDEGGRWRSADALRTLYEQALHDEDSTSAILHCGSGVTACHTLLGFEHAGLPMPRLYVGSWSEWCRSGREIAKAS